jgi:plastocyanin domain-containing protein
MPAADPHMITCADLPLQACRPVNQILLAALALGLLCVIVWGYRMWWQRRPTRADRRALAGTPPRPAAVSAVCRSGSCSSVYR